MIPKNTLFTKKTQIYLKHGFNRQQTIGALISNFINTMAQKAHRQHAQGAEN
jgi:hypothetical protein